MAYPTIPKWSEQQKTLRIKIYQLIKPEIALPFGKSATTYYLISKRFKKVAVEETDAMADQITSTDNCRKIFHAAKQLCSTKPTPPIIVQDTDGNFMGTDKGKARVTKDWFQQQFTAQQHEPLQLFDGTQLPL